MKNNTHRNDRWERTVSVGSMLAMIVIALLMLTRCAPDPEAVDTPDPGSCGSQVDLVVRVVDVLTDLSIDGANVLVVDESTGTVMLTGDDPEAGTVLIIGVTLCEVPYSITIWADGYKTFNRTLWHPVDTYEEITLGPE